MEPWQLAWRDDNTAPSARPEGGYYIISPLNTLDDDEMYQDFEVELILPEGSVYIGIYAGIVKAKMAAEYYELKGELAPTEAPETPDDKFANTAVKVMVVIIALMLMNWALGLASHL